MKQLYFNLTNIEIIFRRPNIFDNMMAMMEKYANNLEVLVDERTDQLVEEKKKTGKIILSFLKMYFILVHCILYDRCTAIRNVAEVRS